MTTATIHTADHDGWYKNCQHPDCKTHKDRYRKRWTYERSHGHLRLVDVEPTRRHVASLLGSGWSLRAIAGAADVAPSSISRIKNSDTEKIQGSLAAKVLAIDPHQVPSLPSRQTSEPFVSRVGATRRIQALLRMGWSHAAMLRHSGVRTGVLLNQQGRWCTRSTHDAVAAMYGDLSHQIGPSFATRGRAERLGYFSPADWDDIDHDDAPDTGDLADTYHDVDVDEAVVLRVLAGHLVVTNNAERHEITTRWCAAGRSLKQLEHLTGWKVDRYRDEVAS